jgi:ATP-dependent RNA helicase RhlE
VNYDVPQHPEDYVHRIGRTGRAEARGDAFTIMVAEDQSYVDRIERFIGRKIERVKVEKFNYQYTALFDAEKKPGTVGTARGVRLSGGGYYFGPAKRRRR